VSEAGAVEAVERIVNRGGDPAAVLDAVLRSLRERGFQASVVDGSLRIADASGAFTSRVATLISPYVR
jgi:hypothetical protein